MSHKVIFHFYETFKTTVDKKFPTTNCIVKKVLNEFVIAKFKNLKIFYIFTL